MGKMVRAPCPRVLSARFDRVGKIAVEINA
jgi:hypothetical protein